MNPGLQGVSSQLSPLPTEIYNLNMSVIIHEINRHDSIKFQIKDIVFSTEIEPRSPMGYAEYTPLHH